MIPLVSGLLVLVPFTNLGETTQEAALATVDRAELLAELASAPLDNEERVTKLIELYKQAGATDDDIQLQNVPAGRPEDPVLQNVIVTKPGESDRTIVVGGHLDKAPVGAGVIDDWSGTCMASNLYQALREVPTRHTFVFMGFAYEEEGLVGSRLYVRGLGEEGQAAVAAMVNLECLGPAGPLIWTNGSTDELEAIAHRVADEAGLPLEDHVLRGVGADSVPFDRAGIPNITFDGLPREKFGLIHSDQDVFENVDQDVYVNTYELVLQYLLELDDVLSRDEENPVQSDRD